jgi:hypothetical protein
MEASRIPHLLKESVIAELDFSGVSQDNGFSESAWTDLIKSSIIGKLLVPLWSRWQDAHLEMR